MKTSSLLLAWAVLASSASVSRAALAPQSQSGHQKMVARLRAILDSTEKENPLLGAPNVVKWKATLESLPADAAPKTRFAALMELGDALVYYGQEREGLVYMQQAWDMPKEPIPEQLRMDFGLRFAAAWLRLAETDNCIAFHNEQSCILPLGEMAQHKKTEGSKHAMALLAEILDWAPKDSSLYLNARWLINMTAMTLGQYPDGVPEAHRIAWSYFEGDDKKFQHFINVAPKVGLDYTNLAGSVSAEDFDNDGDFDLMITSYAADGQTEFYVNRGDGTFEQRTEQAGLIGILGGLGLFQADYDNDGFVDALIPRGAWLGALGLQPMSLLHNNGNGTFTDRTMEAGLGDPAFALPTNNAAWFDYDNDGDLDLYVGHEQDENVKAPCQLFQNQGNGTFVELGAKAGVTNERYTKGVTAGDYDGDRWPDLYVMNIRGENRLYRNKGDGTFEDVATKLGVLGPKNKISGWFWDYDNDGALDIFVNPFGAKPGDLAAAALHMPFEADVPRLYKGDGKGGFTDVSKAQGFDMPYSAMGSNMGDLDNDGYLDVYAGTGRPQARDLVPNVAYHNKRGQGFDDVTLASGLGHLQKGHGIAFADFDSDGDDDVFAQMGGAFRSDLFPNALFENPSQGTRWLAVRLEGKGSNRSAIGARIRADIVENGAKRSVFRWVGSGGTFGASPLRQHLGLGKAEKLEQLEVFWPKTGKTQVFKDVPLDRYVQVVEGNDKPTVTELKPVKLGGGE